MRQNGVGNDGTVKNQPIPKVIAQLYRYNEQQIQYELVNTY